MIARTTAVVAVVAILGAATDSSAQYTWFAPEGSFAAEVSLENSPYLRLPMYRNAITSLAIADGDVIGGTSARDGESPFLFAVSLQSRRMEAIRDLAEVVPGQRAIVSGFARGGDGALVAGTLPTKAGGDGHLITVQRRGLVLEIRDLGVPVAGEGVFAVAVDATRGVVYGISHPSGRFFVRPLSGGAVTVFGETAPTAQQTRDLHGFVLKPEDYLSRRLALDGQGRVYGSAPPDRLFRFDPVAARVEMLQELLPEGWGRKSLGRVDAWAVTADGTLYGGNAADGQLFSLDPTTGAVTNLGKPTGMPGLRGLAVGKDGALYGVAGGTPGYSHLFRYDPRTRGFRDLGNPRFRMHEPGMEMPIPWRAFRIGSVAASEDGGFIALGEDEALSQLLVFEVRRRE
jgi:hypothetical protein